jgi:hypothetical protein
MVSGFLIAILLVVLLLEYFIFREKFSQLQQSSSRELQAEFEKRTNMEYRHAQISAELKKSEDLKKNIDTDTIPLIFNKLNALTDVVAALREELAALPTMIASNTGASVDDAYEEEEPLPAEDELAPVEEDVEPEEEEFIEEEEEDVVEEAAPVPPEKPAVIEEKVPSSEEEEESALEETSDDLLEEEEDVIEEEDVVKEEPQMKIKPKQSVEDLSEKFDETAMDNNAAMDLNLPPEENLDEESEFEEESAEAATDGTAGQLDDDLSNALSSLDGLDDEVENIAANSPPTQAEAAVDDFDIKENLDNLKSFLDNKEKK